MFEETKLPLRKLVLYYLSYHKYKEELKLFERLDEETKRQASTTQRVADYLSTLLKL